MEGIERWPNTERSEKKRNKKQTELKSIIEVIFRAPPSLRHVTQGQVLKRFNGNSEKIAQAHSALPILVTPQASSNKNIPHLKER